MSTTPAVAGTRPVTGRAAEALAELLFRWNTPDDPYFVVNGRVGEFSEEDPYLPIARAALIAIAHGQVPGVVVGSTDVPPGPCWHDPGVTWPDGRQPRCELLAGHAGAHMWDRRPSGGTAVWTDEGGERTPGSAPAPAAETPAGGRAPVDGVAPDGSEPTSPPAGLTDTERARLARADRITFNALCRAVEDISKERGAATLVAAANAVKDVRDNGLPKGISGAPYSPFFEEWLRWRASDLLATVCIPTPQGSSDGVDR